MAHNHTPPVIGSDHMSTRKILQLLVGSLGCSIGMLCAGTVYLYAAYGPQIDRRLNLTQTEGTTIVSIGDYGLYAIGPVMGWLVDSLSLGRYILMLASFFCFGGAYTLMALAYQGLIGFRSWVAMSIYFLIVGLSGAAMYSSTLVFSVTNFPPRYRGLAVAIPVSFFGLSSFTFSQIKTRFFPPDETGDYVYHYLLFLAIATSSCVFASLSLMLCAKWIGNEPTVTSPIEAGKKSESDDDMRKEVEPEVANIDKEDEEDKNMKTPLITRPSEAEVWGSQDEIYDVPIKKFLIHPVAWFHFVSMFFVCGFGLTYLNTCGTLVLTLMSGPPNLVAADDPVAEQGLQVSILSLCNFSGRLLVGIFCDLGVRLPHSFRPQRWAFRQGLACFAALAMCLGALGAALATSQYTLRIATAVVGLAYGASFAVYPVIASEWFGTTNLGRNWGFLLLAPALGGQAISLLFGYFYDTNVENGCEQGECYRNHIGGGAAVLASILIANVAYLARRYVLIKRAGRA